MLQYQTPLHTLGRFLHCNRAGLKSRGPLFLHLRLRFVRDCTGHRRDFKKLTGDLSDHVNLGTQVREKTFHGVMWFLRDSDDMGLSLACQPAERWARGVQLLTSVSSHSAPLSLKQNNNSSPFQDSAASETHYNLTLDKEKKERENQLRYYVCIKSKGSLGVSSLHSEPRCHLAGIKYCCL